MRRSLVLFLLPVTLMTDVVASAQDWIEIDDAGSLPGQEQVIAGNGPLFTISGNTAPDDLQDMYLIFIDDPFNFQATTDNGVIPGGAAAFDTQLWLLDAEFMPGLGLLANDDCFNGCPNFHSHLFRPATDATAQDLPGPGAYFLAISGLGDIPLSFDGGQDVPIFNIPPPFNEVSGPDGPGGPFPVSNWTNNNPNMEFGSYTIALIGASFLPAGCQPPNCDDQDPCTIDNCNDGQCEHILIDCDDADDCTQDFCEPQSGQCVHPPELDCLLEPPCTECKEALKTAPCGCGGERECGGSVALGDPTYLFSGEFYEHAVDLEIKGRGIDFVWARKYRSLIGPVTAQGNGWDFSYNIWAEPHGPEIVIHDGHTRADTYVLQGDGTWTRDGFFRVLTVNPDTSLTLTFEDTGSWNFLPQTHPQAPGRIGSMVDRNGNSLTFDYDAQGRLTTIHDTLDTPGHNRDVTVAYNADGLIASVTDFMGRQVTYEYYDDGDGGGSAGDLKSVTTPAVSATPTGNDFPDGKTTVYTYTTGFDDEQLNHDLLTITDPKGQVYLQNVYAHTVDVLDFRHTENPAEYYFGRVVRQMWGDPDDIIDYVYEPVVPDAGNNFAVTQTIVNDRVGNVTALFFDIGNRNVLQREYTGRWDEGSPTPAAALLSPPIPKLRGDDPDYFEQRWEYNQDSLPTVYTDINLNTVIRVYDESNVSRRSQGNLVQRNESAGPLGGDQPMLTEIFEYDEDMGGCCGTNFVTRHVDARGHETFHEYDAVGNRTHTTHRLPSIVEDWEYNAFGQVIQHVQPDNGSGCRRVDVYTYYTPADGAQNGYLQERIVDATTPESCPGPHFELTTAYEYDAVGNVTRAIDPSGQDTLYEYNALDQVVRELSREVMAGGGMRYERLMYYDANDNVVRVDDENLDENGAVPGGNSHFTTLREYDILNDCVRSCTEAGDYAGTIPGPVELPTCQGLPDSAFNVTEYAYDSNRNRVMERMGEAVNGNQPGNVVQTLYDERDLVFREIRAPGLPDSATIQYDYDDNRNLRRTLQGLEDAGNERETTYTYDGYDRLVGVTDPMGNTHAYHYDANGNLVSRRVDGQLLDIPGSVDNDRLEEVVYQYDAMDRRTREEQALFDSETQAPLGDGLCVTETTYSDHSAVIAVTNDNNHTTTTTYDTAHRVVTVTDAKLNTVTYTYDANSRVTALAEVEKSDLGTPDEQFALNYAYDGLDRLTQRVDTVGNTAALAYDSRDNRVVMVDALGHETRFAYDGINRLTLTVHDLDGDGADGDGDDISVAQSWDDTSRLVQQTDDNGNASTYAYDALNRLTQEGFADGTSQSYTYDVHDNRLTRVDANGSHITSTYDRLDRVTVRQIDRAAVADGDPVDVLGTTLENFAYDGLSRVVAAEDDDSLVTRSYDSCSRMTRETQNGQTVLAVYDGVGNLTESTYPGGRVISSTYDELERLKTISDTGGLIASYEFVGPGRVQQRDYGNGTRSAYTYDGITGIPNPPGDFGVRKIIGTTHTRVADSSIIDERVYQWDRMGNKTQRVDLRPGGSSNTYAYDAAYRLTLSTSPLGVTGYDVDGAGNRLAVTGPLDPGVYTLDRTLPEPADSQLNQYTTTPFDSRLHDPNGNLVERAGRARVRHDYRNQMVEYLDLTTGQRHTYAYDALGRRIARVLNADGAADETRYIYDGWRVCEEQDAVGVVLATYVYGLYIDEVLNMERGGADYYYHADDQYNVMALTDAAGDVVERYDYRDYGQPVSLLCPWDINGDGAVNAADLAVLLGGWGPNPGHPADLTGDGTINAADLAVLLGHWGPCPAGVGNPYLFTGRRYDPESGWYHYRTRYLDPQAGRFTTRDTIGMWADPFNLGNGQSYTANNPWSWADPTGFATKVFKGKLDRLPKIPNPRGIRPVMEYEVTVDWECKGNRASVQSPEVKSSNLTNGPDQGGLSVVVVGYTETNSVKASSTTTDLGCPKGSDGSKWKITVKISWMKRRSFGLNPGIGPISVDLGLSGGFNKEITSTEVEFVVDCCCPVQQ